MIFTPLARNDEEAAMIRKYLLPYTKQVMVLTVVLVVACTITGFTHLYIAAFVWSGLGCALHQIMLRKMQAEWRALHPRPPKRR